MSSEELLENFGLPASLVHRDELRSLLACEIELEQRGKSGEEMLRTICLQLFSLAVVEDALLIWKAKQSSFDAACGIDIQFVCGAGLTATKHFLSHSEESSAAEALDYLNSCEQAGDFEKWSPAQSLADYRRYYGLD